MTSFARSLFTVSGLTFLSRIAGFVRDFLTAVFLGAGPVADAFFVALRLPNLFRSLFAEGAFAAAFVPLYATEQERNGKDAAQRFAGQALALLVTALIPFSVVIMIFMPTVMHVLAPGFASTPEKFDLAVKFSTITFPYLALISITALQTGVLNAHGKFAPGAAAPICFNFVLIAGILAAHFFKWDVGYSLAWAVTVSGLVQCAWLAMSCYRVKLSIPILRPRFDEIGKTLFRRIGPGALGAGAAQINLLISTILASTLSTGAISYLFYADRLYQLPLGIVGIAVATTLLPVLARQAETDEADKTRHYNSKAIEYCLVLGLPAMVGLIMLAAPIIETLFQHGRFRPEDTLATAAALHAYALGVPGFLLVKVFATALFARHDTKTPVKFAIVSMIANVVAAVSLLSAFEHVGIALASSIAVSLNAFLLFLEMRRKNIPLCEDGFGKKFAAIVASALGMGLICYLLLVFGWNAIDASVVWQKIVCLGSMILFAAAAYGGGLVITGVIRVRNLGLGQ